MHHKNHIFLGEEWALADKNNTNHRFMGTPIPDTPKNKGTVTLSFL
jgi:hypothetical protein